MYRLVGTVKSRAFRVLWLLEELGLPYEHVGAGPQSDEVRALNPSGKVPVLIAEGEAVTDSTAILTYLADCHGAFTHPAGTLARARQDSLTQMVLDELDSCLWTAARHSFVLPEALRVPAVKESLRYEFARSVAALSARLGDGPFLTGEAMTVPDIVAVHCGTWAVNAKFPVEDARFLAYLERMKSRPAWQRAAAM
ncbi:glutathione S-transferase family protein [Oceaniglobus roseus]|uniref:glutathione S-transferase family protein n=1 Tax=Oceaniglobus roseus TaxID=1737570 RepID=UPI000C7E8F84|nr:glutathione S-transferase family protein [Kandeliimicrobium roseum]